ncbi:Rdx family-domain-containing protein [Aspergillus alliaceus]|uniref:Rdx family-domain-containing protein n=3 Tax=Petromyces alliaceus TaxID=209559 RepID=A0A5N7CQZ9_PETAA|nr:Rdx family-domain-containing protein [Aspergillus alliaceus]
MTTSIDPKKTATGQVHLPRITIKYCTQCKWMLRAAYFAQELLSTFSTDLGEVALIPATGGIFRITMYHSSGEEVQTQETVLWDRKTNGGFPEVKMLKSLVRNVVDPSRDLGHTDRALRAATSSNMSEAGEKECEDCR